MRRRLLAAAVLATGAALAAAMPAAAQDTVTPAGPATVRGNWLGAFTLELRPPEILVGWTVTVGPGGKAGPVRLRVLRPGDRGTVVGSGPVEALPATPGSYAFALPVGIPYDPRNAGLALDQEVGGHAIVRTHPPAPGFDGLGDAHALDVFRPLLAEEAAEVAFSERRERQELLVRGTIERDLDEDLVGDVTQDVGDLRLLRASILARDTANVPGRETDRVLIAARVLNAGSTVRHLPHIAIPDEISGWSCAGSAIASGWIRCAGAPIAPGGEADLRIWSYPGNSREPTHIEVAAEGPDLTPEDNAGAIRPAQAPAAAPRLSLRAVGGRELRVRLTVNRAGTAVLTARVAGLRIRRTLRFAVPGTRTARLMPSARRDRRRLAAARRRPGRLRATVTATMAGVRTTARTTLP
ncbi:MAG: hypothetical protein LC798_00910 [Chloroflexi bacterium]|nr:hypothetical protein [Chloroflexota bacterium]